MRNIFLTRRQNILKSLPDNSLWILPAAHAKARNGNTDYLFRQDSDFYYLTGYTEPDAILVLYKKNTQVFRDILFNLPKNIEAEIWTGERIGIERAQSEFLFTQVFELSEFDAQLSGLLEHTTNIYWPFKQPDIYQKISKYLSLHQISHMVMRDSMSTISAHRLIKSPTGIKLIRKATQISCQAHTHIRTLAKPGVSARDLEAEFIYFCQKQGARVQAYPPIIAQGSKACVLHYQDNQQVLTANQLLLIDAGCEFDYYASDITRTYPISDQITPEQQKLYALVLRAQIAGIKMVKPGILFSVIQDTILDILVSGLLDLKLLSGSKKEMINQKLYLAFYPHSSGHWLGLDVHDPGNYQTPLAPNMVFTVEPGLYIQPNNMTVPPAFRGIGIRIEDNILVTETGHENLTASLSKTLF